PACASRSARAAVLARDAAYCSAKRDHMCMSIWFHGTERKEGRVEYRSLGRTGMQVSKLSLGAMLFGDETDEAAATALVEHAIEAEVNSIDTANIYGRGR